MRIGLYGLPTARKSFVLTQIKDLEVLAGSSMLQSFTSNFSALDDVEKTNIRIQLAKQLQKKIILLWMDIMLSVNKLFLQKQMDNYIMSLFIYMLIQ